MASTRGLLAAALMIAGLAVGGCGGGVSGRGGAGDAGVAGDGGDRELGLDGGELDPWRGEDASVVDESVLDGGGVEWPDEPPLPDGEPDPEPPPDPVEPEPPVEEDVTAPDPDDGAATEVRASYRVLHWNIAGGKEHACATGAITDAVLRLVRERDADFVGLNEVCPAQYRAIREALRRHWGKSDTAVFSAFVLGGRVGNAIFSRQNLTDFTRQKIGEDRYGDRNLLCGRVAARPDLRFCSTHLSPAPSLAVPQLNRVHERLEQWWTNQRDTVILAGDFNLEPSAGAFDAIYASGASHPDHNPANFGHYRELDDDDTAHCRGYGERSVPRTGGGPCAEGRRIDLVFVRANRIVDGRYGSDTLDIPGTCGGLCSDHRPVSGWARVRVRED